MAAQGIKSSEIGSYSYQSKLNKFELNETVRVKEGPFADFSGAIVEINEDQLKNMGNHVTS